MKMRIYLYKLVLLLILTIFSIQVTGDDALDFNFEYKENFIISEKTAGSLYPDGLIIVKFKDKQVSEKKFNKKIKNRVFKFKPYISGETYWEDANTLVFKPKKDMKMRKNYRGTLSLEALFPAEPNFKKKKVELSFYVYGREVGAVDAGFRYQNSDDKEDYAFEGTIYFNYKTDLKTVKKAVKFLFRDDKISERFKNEKIDIFETGDNKVFKFKSRIIKKDKYIKEGTLEIDDMKLNLTNKYIRDYRMSSAGNLNIRNVYEVDRNGETGVEISFSDDLIKNGNYKGFIQVKPFLTAKLRVKGNKVLINGDFRPGERYSIKFNKGLKSRNGYLLDKEFTRTITIKDIEPKVEFSSNGIFIPATNKEKIRFKTVNVKKLRLKVKEIYREDINSFLNLTSYFGSKNRKISNTEKLGKVVVDKVIEIGEEKNRWLQSEIDLAELFRKNKKGMFIIELEYGVDDLLYEFAGGWSYSRIKRYINENGKVEKPIVISDIGIIVKEEKDKLNVYAVNVVNNSLISEAKVSLKSSSNGIISSATSNKNGKVSFKDFNKDKLKYIEVTYKNQVSLLNIRSDKLSSSILNTGGVNPYELDMRAFIYTERGVYRPGDEINISVILRNKDNTFPVNHPVIFKIYNPRNTKVQEYVSKEGIDGFYNYTFKSSLSDITGKWRVDIDAGAKQFSHPIKIETVVPYKLKLDIENKTEKALKVNSELDINVNVKYLFGNPAKRHKVEADMELVAFEKKFKKYSDFTFNNPAKNFSKIKSLKFKGESDVEGNYTAKWNIPELSAVPSGLKAVVKAKALEKGGRPVPDSKIFEVDFYDKYVGIKAVKNGEYKLGKAVKMKALLVDKNGNPIKDEVLNYRVYYNRQYWWWDYDNINEFKKHFKTNYETELINSGKVTTKNSAVEFSYIPDEYGETLIEVQYKDGHTASYFFRIQSLVDSRKSSDSEILNLATNKNEYKVGENARLIINTPYKGKALISVENKDKVVKSYWLNLKSTKTIEQIKVTEEMAGTTYFYVTVIQPHNQTINDRALRLYGASAVQVENKKTILDLQVKTPSKIKPGEKFKIEVNEKNGKEFQYTIAIVDEGLLNIDKFKTPDPIKFFKQKEMLLVNSYDMFNNILGANWDKVYKTFSVGGDGDAERAMKREFIHKKGEKVQRFKPVSMFRGPIKSDKNGRSVVEFEMPNYVGSVRVMIIANKANGYGKFEKSIPVKSELMVLPTLPRMLAPNDIIEIPVSVFALAKGVGKTKVTLKAKGEVEIVGDDTKLLSFDTPDEKELNFKLKVKNSVGKVKIEFLAESKNYRADKKIDIEIVSPLEYEYSKKKMKLKKDEKGVVKLQGDGITGSNLIKLTLSRKPNIEFNSRLNYLIKYPYGCVEQTTSSVFPQVYLKYLFEIDKTNTEKIDKNINFAIKKLRKFQTNRGGFAYWEYGKSENIWGTNYAGHFLIEARNAGYYVPNDMFNKWLKYQSNSAKSGRGSSLERAYRLYLLGLAGEFYIGEMNVLKQNHFDSLSSLAKWYLAGAYKLAGADQSAFEIMEATGVKVDEYRETGGTYGSRLRDRAAMLETMVYLDEENKSFFLYKDILDEVISNKWMSTQEAAYSLLAISKYLKGSSSNNGDILLEMQIDGEEKQYLQTDKMNYSFLIEKGFGKNMTLINGSKTPINISLEWEGIPKSDKTTAVSNKIDVDVKWFSNNGEEIDPSVLKQGDVIWGCFRVKNSVSSSIENMALVQLIPSGWEIANLRVLGEHLPEWLRGYKLNYEEYLDIKDNKIMWFFDFEKYDDYYDFVVKINAVSVGEYYLPAVKFEAMYDNNYLSTNTGKRVQVRK